MKKLSWAAAVLAFAVLAGAGYAPAIAAGGTPEKLCTFDVKELPEVSGITPSIRHKNVVWVHNDSSGGAVIYALDLSSCKIVSRLTLADMPARDIEAIASGRDAAGNPVLWVGDFGDNQESWPFVRIYQVPEPKTLTDQTVPVRAWRFAYPDGPHNAETLLADPRKPQLWVVTKALATGVTYRLPALPTIALGEVWKEPLVAQQVGETDGLISDGAVSGDASRFVLRDYLSARIYSGLPPGKPIVSVELPTEQQGEAVTWARDGRALLVAGEREGTLWSVPLPPEAWTKSAQDAQASANSDPGSTFDENGSESESPLSFGALIGVIALGLLIVVGLAGARFFRR
ncbi:MAG: hypothetical protein WCP26_08820 [Actinomycetes bacterium]